MTQLPNHFAKTIAGVLGDVGQEWLDQFPQILAAVAERYELTLGDPFALSYNYVCAATTRDDTPVVLKLSPPYAEFKHEVNALRHYDVRGSVQVLDVDLELRAVILERVAPGDPLRTLALRDDDLATHIAVEVMQNLWKPLPAHHTFPTIADWSQGLQDLREQYDGSTGPMPTHLVERAEAIYRELLVDAPPAVLLHGDLHHDNILSATRTPYLAIDPKGLAGEPAYEIGPFFYNPFPEIYQRADLDRVLARRLAIFAEHLPFDRERLLACAFAHSVLSAAWSVESNDDGWRDTARISETLLTFFS